MATPARGSAPGGLKMPKGRFWIGKCESGATSINDFMAELRKTLQEFQRAQIVARLIEAATAKRRNQLAPRRDLPGGDFAIAPGKDFVAERKGAGVFVVEHSSDVRFVPLMFERQHPRAENI